MKAMISTTGTPINQRRIGINILQCFIPNSATDGERISSAAKLLDLLSSKLAKTEAQMLYRLRHGQSLFPDGDLLLVVFRPWGARTAFGASADLVHAEGRDLRRWQTLGSGRKVIAHHSGRMSPTQASHSIKRGA
jgi:hypothetical protein